MQSGVHRAGNRQRAEAACPPSSIISEAEPTEHGPVITDSYLWSAYSGLDPCYWLLHVVSQGLVHVDIKHARHPFQGRGTKKSSMLGQIQNTPDFQLNSSNIASFTSPVPNQHDCPHCQGRLHPGRARLGRPPRCRREDVQAHH